MPTDYSHQIPPTATPEAAALEQHTDWAEFLAWWERSQVPFSFAGLTLTERAFAAFLWGRYSKGKKKGS